MKVERKPIRNSRGERIFDLVWKNGKVYLETYHKGKITMIMLLDELYKIYKELKPDEKVLMLKIVSSLAKQDLSITY